ncbi:sulfatase-like hydrolase/transferase [Persicirhabdus sediminis]|uniref:Sulfatase-like hydrolase/transferase n=1 Tax=Persicirhabdus sediminis TaxID=454144 RepID=A0A8J7SHQ2_9BACT|nr:sulfatase-like hydrolase/transferase [Persicirhabdus sediminis]MBK1790935.1 sulfatase-like hydrolase/transferase [Persicirhabdus sediminis]
MVEKKHILGLVAVGLAHASALSAASSPLPNILWLSSEDNSPTLACYGDTLADTPQLDKLAAEGVRYEWAYANAPVCAPARFTLLMGNTAQRMGTLNMRSNFPIPDEFEAYLLLLRRAGYYNVFRDKYDYNYSKGFEMLDTFFDERINDRFWKHDKPSKISIVGNRPADKPFFCHLNILTSHESAQLRLKDHEPSEEDKARMLVPPYQMDTDSVRKEWAKYYFSINEMDTEVGRVLRQLEREGLADDTIVFYFGDHGGTLPRSKRYLYETGTRVPLLIYFPEKFKHLAPAQPGEVVDRLVGFSDFAPTVLSLAGVQVPEYMEGKPFLGEQDTEESEYLYFARERMDSLYDTTRAVRWENFHYIRNYMPHRPLSLFCDYQKRCFPSVMETKSLYQAGEGNAIQRALYEAKDREGLYDVVNDPWEVNNLANDAKYKDVLVKLRDVNNKRVRDVKDPAFVPESIYGKVITPFHYVREEGFPIDRIIETAEMVDTKNASQLPELIKRLSDDNESVRFWAAHGCLALGANAQPAKGALMKSLDDPCLDVGIVAAEALTHLGEKELGINHIIDAMETVDRSIFFRARCAVEAMDKKLFADYQERLENLDLKHFRHMISLNPALDEMGFKLYDWEAERDKYK